MRISIIIFFTIILLGIGSYYVFQKGIPQGWARGKIIRYVEERLNGQLKIKSLHFKFPNQVILQEIKLNPTKTPLPPLVEIKEIVCKYNLIASIFHSEKLVSKIEINEPAMYLYRNKAGKWNFTSLFKPQPEIKKKPPQMTITIKKAKLAIEDEILGEHTTFDEIYGSYYPQGLPSYFHMRMGHQIKISGNIYELTPLEASFHLRVIKMDISNYAGFFKNKWANLVEGKISATLRGKIQAKQIEFSNLLNILELGNLTIRDGVIKLTHLPQPITDIEGNFSLLGHHSLLANELKFKFKDIAFTTKRFYMHDIEKKEAVIEVSTSMFYLKELGDIFPYLSKLNLKSKLKFSGGVNFEPDFSLFGEAELLNQTSVGNKFPILANFKYKDKIFDHISLFIDKNTHIEGKVDIEKKLFHLTTKFDKSDLLPLSSLLSGKKKLEKGIITGKIIAQGKLEEIQYNGDLELALNENPILKEIIANFQGDNKSITFSSQLIQPHGKIQIQGNGKRANIKEPFSLSLMSILDEWNIFNKDISARITFDGKWGLTPRLIGGDLKAEKIIIDKDAYPDWQGSLIYDHPKLNISTSPQITQLSFVSQITFSEPLTASLQIKTKNTNLGLLTKKVKGTFDGEFNLQRISRSKTTICGKSVKVNLVDGGSLTGDFAISKMEDEVYIEHLILKDEQKINMVVAGKINFSSPQAVFMDLQGKIYNLAYKNLTLNTSVEFKGYLSNSQLNGKLNFTEGKVNNFIIDRGEVKFSYANQLLSITESGIVLEHGGILTTFGTVDTNGKINLKFSLLGMNYQDMPYTYFKPFMGQFDFFGEVKGDIDNPIMSGLLESNRMIVAHEKITNLSAEIRYSNDEFQILDSKINDKLSFRGRFQTKDNYLSGILQIKENTKLTTLTSLLLLPSKNLEGVIKGQIEIKGALNNLALKSTVEIENFHIPGFEATYGEVKFTLENKILSFQKLCFLQANGGKIEFEDYQLEIKPDGKVSLTAIMENFTLVNVPFDGKVYFTGTGIPWYKAKGTLMTKNLLINQSDTLKRLTVEIYYEDGLLEFIPLPKSETLAGKIKFISNEKLEIKEMKILKSKAEQLKVDGDVELLAKRWDIKFVMDNSDLKILPLWLKEIKKPEGKIDGWLHLGGKFDEPLFNGVLTITDGVLTTFPFAKRVTMLHGQIRIVNNWFVSNFLEARVGKSILVMRSNAPFTLKDIDIDIKSSHKSVPISIPGCFEGGVEVDIQIKGDIVSPIGSGNIKIVNAKFTYPPRTKTTEGRIRWQDIMITTGKNVRYYNEYVDVSIKRKGSWLKLSSDKDEICANGIVYALAGGKVNYLGKNFTIKKACLEFRESNLLPYLSGYAVTRLGKRQIILTYEGYIGEAKPTLQSPGGYPPMNEEQIVTALLTGKTEYADLNTTDKDTILKLGFGQVVGKEIAFSLLSPVETQIGQLLGLDVKLQTSILEQMFEKSVEEEIEEKRLSKSTSIFAESEFRIGKLVSEDLYLSYRGILKPWEEEEFARLKLKQELELEYYLSGNTSLKYKFSPEGVWQKGDEHEIVVEREVRF